MNTLSADVFRLVWTNANSADDFSSKTFDVIGSRDAVWNLWYTLTYKSGLSTTPKIFSLDGREQHPENGIHELIGVNDHLKYNPKKPV